MKMKNVMLLTGALLLAGGATMFGMSSDSVEGTETKTECRAQGGEGRGKGGRQSCGANKGCDGKERQYRNRKGEGRGEGFQHHGRKGKNAGQGHRRGGQQSGRRMQRGQMMGKMLNLTEKQQAQVKALREKNSEQMKASHQALRDAHKALREASQAEKIDETKIRQLSKILADKMADAALARAKGMKEFKALLTKEQLAKLAAKKAEFTIRMAAMKSKRAAACAGKSLKKATK